MNLFWQTMANIATVLFSGLSLIIVIRVAIDYGKRAQTQEQHGDAIREIRENVRTILGNGHPGPFVPREVYQEHVQRNGDEHRHFGRRIELLEEGRT